MSLQSGFLRYILDDVMGDITGITARAMFGGYGLYQEGVIFGIIVENQLYFKADDSNRSHFQKLQSQPFAYEGQKGKKIVMSYWEVPAQILDDRVLLRGWVLQAVSASKRSQKKPALRKKK